MADEDVRIEEMAGRHNFSAEAARTLLRAIRAGGGNAAQFSHPEFGGMGQWSRGGMVMIGDMFNDLLKSRVTALCDDLAGLAAGSSPQSASSAGTHSPATDGGWWPAELGRPIATGAQNDMRYAFFPGARRLAIRRGGATELYDTGEHSLSGFSQAQSTGQTLAFSSQHGPVPVASLRRLDGEPSQVGAAHSPATPEPASADPFAGLERLHELHSKGVVTTEEFAAKKQELLARI